MQENRLKEKRLIVVLLSYAFSSPGLFFMLMGLMEFARQSNKDIADWLMAIVWITAWVCHIVMCTAWIKNKRLGPVWPIAGTLAGSSSFLILGWVARKVIFPFDDIVNPMTLAMGMMKRQLLLVFPCFLLALWLVCFHCRKKSESSAA